MKKRFIETSSFTSWVDAQSSQWDESLADLQFQLMGNPEAGRVMKGCGGLRKIRMGNPDRAKGKRGGARIIYLHVPEADWIYLLDVYEKNEQDDLRAEEKKVLAKLAKQLKKEALIATGKADREGSDE